MSRTSKRRTIPTWVVNNATGVSGGWGLSTADGVRSLGVIVLGLGVDPDPPTALTALVGRRIGALRRSRRCRPCRKGAATQRPGSRWRYQRISLRRADTAR